MKNTANQKRIWLMVKSGLALFCAFLSTFVHAQTWNYLPVDGMGEVHQYKEFALSYSEQHEQPYWVAYCLTKEEILLPSKDRVGRFIEDTNITTGSVTHDEYTNTGYDRGHLSRAMYNKRSDSTYKESYFMSNISPQIGVNFNRTGGDWFNLEELEIDLAKGLDSMYCVSGPVFMNNIEVIGDSNAITVPGYFYKAFLSPDLKHAIAFVLKHDQIDIPSLWDAAVPIDQLEGMTGINFFALLPNKEERKIEEDYDLDYWVKVAERGQSE